MTRVHVVPSRMSTRQLYATLRTGLDRLRWMQGLHPQSRDHLINELVECLDELQMRGQQLALLPEPHRR